MLILVSTVKYDNDRQLHWKICAPDDNRVDRYVIALHGFAGSMQSDAIEKLAEKLIPHRTAVFAFNYPGHGNDTQDELFSMHRCQADLRCIIENARKAYPNAEWCGVFATSFGGFLTLNSLDLIPQSVRIVLRAPAVNMPQVLARLVEKDGCGMTEYERTGRVLLGNVRKIQVPYSFYEELCAHDIFMQDLDREMLLIHGDCDELVLPADTAAFCERNPKIMRTVIAGGDHQQTGMLDQVTAAAVPYLLHA